MANKHPISSRMVTADQINTYNVLMSCGIGGDNARQYHTGARMGQQLAQSRKATPAEATK